MIFCRNPRFNVCHGITGIRVPAACAGSRERIVYSDLKAFERRLFSNSKRTCHFLNIRGKTRIGYDVVELENTLKDFLEFERQHPAVIIGVGSLGAALIQDSVSHATDLT